MGLILIIIGALATLVVYLAIKARYLNRKQKQLNRDIKNYPAFKLKGQSEEKSYGTGPLGDLEYKYKNHIVSEEEEQQLHSHYEAIYSEAKMMLTKLERNHRPISSDIQILVDAYESLSRNVNLHNEVVYDEIIKKNEYFLSHCLKYPLDSQQRRAVVSEARNCLVVSSAGSGKTSCIMGKVKYLTEVKHVDPSKILLISYTNKAAAELTTRLATPGLRGYTFHKLALDIISRQTGIKPSICDQTDKIFLNIYQEFSKTEDFQKEIVDYFNLDLNEEDWEKKKRERREKLQGIKAKTIRAAFPDLDGNVVMVRSNDEKLLCYFLTSLGVKFRYEEPYEHRVDDEFHSQYKPDFSIYYEKDGETHRVYLEHFGIDEHGMVPIWFAKDKGISYEEANKKYGDGIEWKKSVHEKYGTRLIYTTSAEISSSVSDNYIKFSKILKDRLRQAGVPIHELTSQELYYMVVPKNSAQEKTFIRSIISFITLLKCNNKSITEVMNDARKKHDEASFDIIHGVINPVYEAYEQKLHEMHELDFSDIIHQATEICTKGSPLELEYIIVDEFQDISLDRYQFLQALRGKEQSVRLFCVGDDWQSIYRFSGSDMALFGHFEQYFGKSEFDYIETTYRFGEPVISLSSRFIQRNPSQLRKHIHPFNKDQKTDLTFVEYERPKYCDTVEQMVASIPAEKSIFLLGRYSFDDYYLSFKFKQITEGDKFYYLICGRKIEFLTVHKSKGLEADYVILLQCNKDIYGFPSRISDAPYLQYVLSEEDQYPFGEERRLFYVAITRAKYKTVVLYDKRFPSVFVNEFLHPEKLSFGSYLIHRNANKKWTRKADAYLIDLHQQGKSIRYISEKMGRSQTSIVMRLGKLGIN